MTADQKQKTHRDRGELETVLKSKVEPVIESSMHRFLGVSIGELTRDLSEKLTKSPLVDFDVDPNIPFKKAKRKFKQQYLQKLLQVNYGNVSEVARIMGVDRRSIHRIIREGQIDVDNIRHELAKAYEIRQAAIGGIIEDVLENYKQVIHPMKFDAVYRSVPELSKDILESLPDEPLTLKEAENEFEANYIRKLLKGHQGNVSEAARAAKIRYETLHRKAKRLRLA